MIGGCVGDNFMGECRICSLDLLVRFLGEGGKGFIRFLLIKRLWIGLMFGMGQFISWSGFGQGFMGSLD